MGNLFSFTFSVNTAEVSCKRTEFEQMTGTLITLKTQALIEMTPVYEAQLLLEKVLYYEFIELSFSLN